MVDQDLEKIVTLCLSMDEQAVQIYSGFAESAQDSELADFLVENGGRRKKPCQELEGGAGSGPGEGNSPRFSTTPRK